MAALQLNSDIHEKNEDASAFDEFKCFHEKQLRSSSVPEYFWETLFYKLQHSIFDAGDVFQVYRIETDVEENGGIDLNQIQSWKVLIIKKDGIESTDSNNIYLVDHAWTYRVHMARDHLRRIPYLLERMAALMDITENENSQDSLIENILRRMWKFNQTYHLGNPGLEVEETLPIWYIMDEFGSQIQHSDEPTFRLVPFFYSPTQMAYSLLFPIKSLQFNEEVTRDYIEGLSTDTVVRKVLKIPWFPCRMMDISFEQKTHDKTFLQSSLQTQESLPMESLPVLPLPLDRTLKIYSEYKPLIKHLTHSRFTIVDDEDEADILWYTHHFKDYKHLREVSPHKRINQFPYENRITVKDLLCVISRLSTEETHDPVTLDTFPMWLPTTFNLITELPQFVSYFQHRKERNLNNIWICKPWNLARSLDIHITDNLDYILRLPSTGPKIVSKYIETPVLFYRADTCERVKFDIRYIVLLKSVNPLTVAVYNRFWLRFSNKAFTLNDFDDYEKHFTVMNYVESEILQMYCHEFIEKFEEQYSDFKYAGIEEKIFSMIKAVFLNATCHPPPEGICENPQSRAMYAVDLMLRWWTNDKGVKEIQPMLLEINWMPDCERACAYYPEFFNDIVSVLFLDDVPLENVTML